MNVLLFYLWTEQTQQIGESQKLIWQIFVRDRYCTPIKHEPSKYGNICCQYSNKALKRIIIAPESYTLFWLSDFDVKCISQVLNLIWIVSNNDSRRYFSSSDLVLRSRSCRVGAFWYIKWLICLRSHTKSLDYLLFRSPDCARRLQSQHRTIESSIILWRSNRLCHRNRVCSAPGLHINDIWSLQTVLLWWQVTVLWRRRRSTVRLLPEQSSRKESSLWEEFGARTFLQRLRNLPIHSQSCIQTLVKPSVTWFVSYLMWVFLQMWIPEVLHTHVLVRLFRDEWF